MDVSACYTVRGRDQETVKGGHGRPVPEPIEAGAVEGGPPIPIIAVDMLVGHVPLGLRCDLIAKTAELLINRLLLLLRSG